MRRPLAFVLAGLVLVLILPTSAGAHEATPSAAAKPEQRRVVMLGLRRPEQKLATFVREVSEPGSSSYGHYLSLSALRRTYGARPQLRSRVVRFLRRDSGLRSVEVDSTGTVVLATFSVQAARRLFCARGMKPPRGGLCLPKALRGGVTELLAGGSYRHGTARASAGRTGTPQGCKAALESNTFTPNQIATASGADELAARGLDGRGIRVDTLSSAIVGAGQLDGWAKCFGLPEPNFKQVAMPSASRETNTAPEETYLDAEALSALAPHLQRITAITVPLVTSFRTAFPLFMLGALDPDRNEGKLPDLLSISDAICESQLSPVDRRLGQHLLRDAAALGITALAASGDLGFLGCQEEAKGASWPASSQYVTAVGGTELTLDAANQITNQIVWATFATEPAGDGVGSGGGPSIAWARPSWQQAPGLGPALQSGKPTRLTPDVAAMGSFTPGLATYGGGEGWGPGGGTSTATPLTAAILALTLQGERAAGRPAFGALNPLLYGLARSASYNSIFSDVLTGTSSPKPTSGLGKSPAGGAAQPGYDLATGLGSLRAGPFAAAVATR